MSALHFAAPLYLWALCLLPVLWWLLKLTPPAPKRHIFPPLRLMTQLSGRETAAAQSPWWLTFLRLLLAALIILAFAQPSRRDAAPLTVKGGALALIWDNSWAGAALKQQQQSEAQRLIRAADRQNSPVYLIPSVSAANAPTGPFSGDEALKRFSAEGYYALPAERRAAFAKLSALIKAQSGKPLIIAYLTDGMAATDDKQAFAALSAMTQNLPPRRLLLFKPPLAHFAGISHAANKADGLSFTLIRAENSKAEPLALTVRAYDEKERLLAETQADFTANAAAANGKFDLPPAYANAAAELKLAPAGGAETAAQTATAAAVRLLNSADKQKTVAILAPRSGNLTQPLLSPLYYVAKALENAPSVAGGKAVQADSGTMEQNIDQLLSAKPALLIMGDTAAVPPQVTAKLRQWVEQGGTLFRLGGTKLAHAETEDNDSGQAEAEAIFGSAADETMPMPALRHIENTPEQNLLPVRLRRGERSFGGSLSWEKPQKLAPFAQNSPFYGLPVPNNIRISKQILAEPSADLADKSWISLTDGTPLLTTAKLGKGRLILLHTEPSGNWSNLALSEFFVEMLQKLTQISDSTGNAAQLSPAAPRHYAPYRILTADGSLESAPETVRALTAGGPAAPQPGFTNPPGLYGSREALYPLNLLNKTSRIAPLQLPQLPALNVQAYSSAGGAALQKLLFLLAACLFIADIILSLLLKTPFTSFKSNNFGNRLKAFFSRAGKAESSNFTLLAAAFALALLPSAPRAQAASLTSAGSAGGLSAPALAGKTHLAYMLSGNAELDAVSQAGLKNLSRFIERRTTIEPGAPVGLDLSRDELSFYPLIYWPIDADAPMPSAKALAAADAFMQRGGTILFDTRDALDSGLKLDGAAPNTARLRAILKGMNVPPLTPAPAENVVARSFYIMPDFPGRYRSSPLWIAASAAGSGENGQNNRSISGGDGVSPILITANDFAAAWADDGKGGFLFPLIPDGEEQRLWSFRGGLNIVMYVLTGNYKADQAHTPELLRRFGQDN